MLTMTVVQPESEQVIPFEAHHCSTNSLESHQHGDCTRIVERCRCGNVRCSDYWPFAECLGEWVTPTAA